MGVFDRLANVARGKVLVWRRGAAPVSPEVEEELRRPSGPVPERATSEHEEHEEDEPVRRSVPSTPVKRRL